MVYGDTGQRHTSNTMCRQRSNTMHFYQFSAFVAHDQFVQPRTVQYNVIRSVYTLEFVSLLPTNSSVSFNFWWVCQLRASSLRNQPPTPTTPLAIICTQRLCYSFLYETLKTIFPRCPPNVSFASLSRPGSTAPRPEQQASTCRALWYRLPTQCICAHRTDPARSFP